MHNRVSDRSVSSFSNGSYTACQTASPEACYCYMCGESSNTNSCSNTVYTCLEHYTFQVTATSVGKLSQRREFSVKSDFSIGGMRFLDTGCCLPSTNQRSRMYIRVLVMSCVGGYCDSLVLLTLLPYLPV